MNQQTTPSAFKAATEICVRLGIITEPLRLEIAAIIEREMPPQGWQPIETAPKDGTYILLASPSGMTSTPLRVEVCRYDDWYHPFNPWVNHAGDSFRDGGASPTLWMPLPPLPEEAETQHPNQ